MIFNKYIDEYIYLIESGSVESCINIKKCIELVKEKLSQYNVFIDNEKIEIAITK